MNKIELLPTHKKKQQRIEDAEARTKILLAQARREGTLATSLWFRLKKLESQLDNATEHATMHDRVLGKPRLQRHYAAKLDASLKGLRSIQREAQDLAQTLHSIKRNGIKNVKTLRKDLKAIR